MDSIWQRDCDQLIEKITGIQKQVVNGDENDKMGANEDDDNDEDEKRIDNENFKLCQKFAMSQ